MTHEMTDEHKAALALGRAQSRAVRAYMEALNTQAPSRRGRKGKSAEDIFHLLHSSTDPLERLTLRAQYRQAVADEGLATIDMDKITDDFIEVAAAYSERLGLSYGDWREEGVPAKVLKEAGIRR